MTDLELISLNLTAEYLSIDCELQLFRKTPNYLKNKIERSVYRGAIKKTINLSFVCLKSIEKGLKLCFHNFVINL